eukprot:CAMPEP_0197846828 /NCGR_PEP_ID=MMETSP1438-20131217/4510_1 /TAXON_ID=1461541 /ORGANISM="Pterosperma sp., Strain CCMP1384" /LENGTH=494 /DNA_ID=CAMNT_0043458603 /DNA_START=142 /DNA_END=1626 /DNA_ORIENTATION=+
MTSSHGYEYDLVVIGGGSGGLAVSKEAAKLGAKVCCLDYVVPTPKGTKWGLGGTCVNVGCIPKKLMHQAGILGEGFSDARAFGWQVNNEGHDWPKMVTGIQDYIGGLNWGYRTALRDNKVQYLNAKGAFVDPHTLQCTKKNGSTSNITFDKCVIAVGGRPKYLGVEGDKECCITSDDVFSLEKSPGKTLCIGASYISLETAGFLTALGNEVTVMARSVFLRGFDTEIADKIVDYMETHGTKIVRAAVPKKFEMEGDKVKVTYTLTDFGFDTTEVYDTVMLAVGRDACTGDLGLDKAGVELCPSGKIDAKGEQTNVPHIYAIGDVLEQRQELTPVAIQAGQLLARRLYANGTVAMDYNAVPTTVFTPLEYGCVGLSEEDAKKTYGEDNIEVYVSYFKPLEWQTNHEQHDGKDIRADNSCYAKLITHIPDNERVIGLHYLGPNAGEVTQGYAVAMKCGVTKAQFDATIGIHPTIAEEFTTLSVTKRSGEDAMKKGC